MLRATALVLSRSLANGLPPRYFARYRRLLDCRRYAARRSWFRLRLFLDTAERSVHHCRVFRASDGAMRGAAPIAHCWVMREPRSFHHDMSFSRFRKSCRISGRRSTAQFRRRAASRTGRRARRSHFARRSRRNAKAITQEHAGRPYLSGALGRHRADAARRRVSAKALRARHRPVGDRRRGIRRRPNIFKKKEESGRFRHRARRHGAAARRIVIGCHAAQEPARVWRHEAKR